ncbi:pantoate--beta-alanine ligase [Paenibacillus beijingensis]|uniref:Pantothenate synthetase n=2 Tax=Paenibacillus beijingensis TaxID=1126833 RepID=A0A0D5NRP2_9BACL|nr:pantoate--beta-alanine ligase [Paenibacillus beijingensis]
MTTTSPADLVTVCRTIDDLKQKLQQLRWANAALTVGFVPTMGYLHEGHASLLRRSKRENDITVLSIFVNPLQFGPGEDLDRYPRDEQRDLLIAAEVGADLVFMPSVQEMYPVKPQTTVLVSGVTERLCGASRPGHFDGVGTVVSKLFNIVQPRRAYFGMKDAQQVAVITTMVNDLNMPIEIVPCPTVREADGLALSSRNKYLSPEERSQALILSATLRQAREWMRKPDLTVQELTSRIHASIASAPMAVIDYAEVLYYPSLEQPDGEQLLSGLEQPLIVALAVKFGATRLIDNMIMNPAKGEISSHV